MLRARQREGLIQAVKMAAAATIAWMIARQVHEPLSFMAPYAAVFIMSETVYRSVADAGRLVATLVLGVLLAFVTITVVPNPAVALPIAVFLGMAMGRWRRLGDSGIWIGVTALLMLTSSTADDAYYLLYRVLEGITGAAIGLAVNLLVLPPLYLRDGRQAVADVAAELADLTGAIAAGLRGDWGDNEAAQWRRRARVLEEAVRKAEEAVRRSRESTWFNPRWLLRHHHEAHDERLDLLYEVVTQIHHMTAALVAASDPDGTAPHAGREFGQSLAPLLDTIASAVADHRTANGDAPDHHAVADTLNSCRDRRTTLTANGLVSPNGEHLDWSTQATLLLAVERACQAILVN